jgi:Rrf2 family protein
MSSLLKVSEAASLALHSAVVLTSHPEGPVPTGEIASQLDVSEAHLSKVLQRLARCGLVRSVRGPKGGFVLGKSADKVSLLEVYEAIDGPLAVSDCLFDRGPCGRARCILGTLVTRLGEQVRDYLSKTRLDAVADDQQEPSRRKAHRSGGRSGGDRRSAPVSSAS